MSLVRLVRSVPGALLTLLVLPCAPARAVEATWSGFATLGYAQSDSPYRYQRDIGDEGGIRRDTLVAGQLDLRLDPTWSATLQAQARPRSDSDRGWALRTAWAFVAWRPDNDWLVRVGKARVPLYLNSESLDVGVATDLARMPHEMYSVAPTNDATGLYATRSIALPDQEITIDAFAGRADTHLRLWLRDGAAQLLPQGALYLPIRADARGLALTSRGSSLTWRLAAVAARSRSPGFDLAARYPRVELAPGIGYWKVAPALPGPDIEIVPAYRNLAVTAGAEWSFGDGWRLAGEAVDMRQSGSELGTQSRAGYVALSRRVGDLTPYLALARQRSAEVVLSWQRRLTTELLPAGLPGAAEINAAQRAAGDATFAYDQRSHAIGASYALSATAKVKAEWMQTQVGQASAHFDTPAGRPGTQGLRVHTWTVNLAVAF